MSPDVTSAASPPATRPPSTLRLERLKKGLTQEQLATMAGLSREQLGRLENGRCRPNRATKALLAMALECGATDLFPAVPGA